MSSTRKYFCSELTPEQEALKPVVRDEWLHRALDGDTSIDIEAMVRGIAWQYSKANLPPPREIVVLDSPMACQVAANLMLRHQRSGVESGVWSGVESGVRSGVESGVESGCLMLEHIVFVSRCPSMVRKIADGEDLVRLHSPAGHLIAAFNAAGQEISRAHSVDGPAIAFADGYLVHAVRGVWFPCALPWVEGSDLVEALHDHSLLSVERILNETNVERRRVLIEDVMGRQRFLVEANPTIVDSDVDLAGMPRQLLRIDLGDDEAYLILAVECPSTGHKHTLRVPPTMERCSQACAWTFGFDLSDHYRPLVEA